LGEAVALHAHVKIRRKVFQRESVAAKNEHVRRMEGMVRKPVIRPSEMLHDARTTAMRSRNAASAEPLNGSYRRFAHAQRRNEAGSRHAGRLPPPAAYRQQVAAKLPPEQGIGDL
jgi:hypothetical protein